MPVALSTPCPSALPRRFHSLDIGEPISVRLVIFGSPSDLRARLKELRFSPTSSILLVVHLSSCIAPNEAMELLDQATARAARVVLIPPRGNSTSSENLRKIAGQQHWPGSVLIEPEPERAVIGAMQSLREGDTFALLWSNEPGLSDPSSLVVQGARWRSSWDAPENGEFHWLPPELGV